MYSKKSVKLGVISFKFFNTDSEGQIERIRTILETNFKDTDAVLLDLRDNIGGESITQAMITSLFTSNPKRVKDRIIVNDAIRTYLRQSYSSSPGSRFSKFEPIKNIPLVKQAYHKPVAVLTDAQCN